MHFHLKNLNPVLKFTLKCYKENVRNISKAIGSDDHVKILTEDTLTGRILHYLNSQNGVQSNLNVPLKSEDYKAIYDSRNVPKLNVNEMILALNSLDGKCYISAQSILKKIDTESCSRLNELQPNHILELLKSYMNVRSNRIMNLRFYQLALKELNRSLDFLSKNDLLRFIFYIGLQKKRRDAQIMLQKCLHKIFTDKMLQKLTMEELCIICNSFFKTSTKIKNQVFLDRIKNCINEDLSIIKDPALFVTLIKTLRHNRYQDDDILSSISCTIFFNKTLELYSFSCMCHILALYADYSYYDEKLVPIFVRKCLDMLKGNNGGSSDIHTYLTERPRTKDLKRFLWVLSNFSHFKLIENDELLNCLVPEIIKRIKSGEFHKDSESLIDITLYLWMIGCRPYDLVPYSLTKENILLAEASKTKSKERLTLLLYVLHVEDPDLFTKLDLNLIGSMSSFSHAFQIKQRPLIRRILSTAKSLANKLEINRFEITQEVPNINILGITGYKKKIYKTVFIEILDNVTCLKNCSDELPTGLMNLKLRLLDQRDEGVVVISRGEVEDLTEAELEEFLAEEINLVCG